MAIIECEHVAGGSQATIACGTCARAEGFAAGRLAGIEEAAKWLHAKGVMPLAWQMRTDLAQPAPAAASEPRSEAAECTICHGEEWACPASHGKPGAPTKGER